MNLQTLMLAALTIAILTLMLAYPLQTIYAQASESANITQEVPIQGLGNETIETPVNVTGETPASNVTN
jgi:hypothetical protein